MMITIKKFLVWIILIGGFAETAACHIAVFTEANCGQTVRSSATQISLSLSALPSAGYDWYISDDTTAILPKEARDTSDASLPGAKITHVFFFYITKHDLLHLVYKRPWESEVAKSCIIQFESY